MWTFRSSTGLVECVDDVVLTGGLGPARYVR